MPSPIVFIDIAGPEDERLRDFHWKILSWEIDGDGQFEVGVMTPLEGAIRKDPAEKRIYLGVPDVSETLDLVEASGGSIDTPRFEVPGSVVLGLFRDPAGNPMGLVETKGGKPKVP